MKRNVLHWFIFSICIILFGCSNDEEINRDFTFIGTVIDASSKEPMPELPVVVTDGNNIHTSTKTNADGGFMLTVNINEISSAYYILIGDDSCIKKTVEIHGFSGGETNLGTIEIIGPSIPIVISEKYYLGPSEGYGYYKIEDSTLLLSASIFSSGHLEIDDKGFCIGKNAKPTTNDMRISCGSGLDPYEAKISITDLDASTTYYIRPYATNTKGTGYGTEFTYTTESGLPDVGSGIYRFDGYTLDMEFYDHFFDSDIEATSVTMNGYLFDNGGFDIIELGFCWDQYGNPSVDTDRKYIVRNELGEYHITIQNLIPNTHYYYRAYAKNKNGVVYGKLGEFTTEKGAEDVAVIELSTIGIAVQTKDIGRGEWDSVNTMCESSIVGGYTDWRLPTKEELMTLYTNRNSIGGFYTKSDYGLSATYWSGASVSSYDYYYIKFWNGELSYSGKTSTRSARCVRSIN